MLNSNRVLFPMPKSSPAFEAFSYGKHYSFPIPSEEFYPELPWPKSLCKFAEQCPVSDDFSDREKNEDCVHAHKQGCPLFLLDFDDFEEFGECKNIEIFEIKQVESKDYTEKDLEKIVENYNKLAKTHKPPIIALGHGENQELLQQSGLPSAGWVSALRTKGKKLLADFKEVPRIVVDAIKRGAYKFPSVEIYRNFVFDNVEYGPVLRRVALLGADIPRIKSLGDIVARYEENGGAILLPVVKSGNEDDNNQSIWLGGESMSKITVKPFSISGEFKVGEELIADKSDFRGTLDTLSEGSLTITITAGKDLSGDTVLTGKDSNAQAQLSEPEPEVVEKVLTISPKAGAFREGEKVYFDDKKEIFAQVKTTGKNKLVILISKDLVDKLSSEGTLTGELSEAKASYPYPSPYKGDYPKPAEKSGEELTKLTEKLDALQANLEQERTERIAAQKKAESYEERIVEQEKSWTTERRTRHLKDIDVFCEEVKRGGLAPALVDEDQDGKLGLKRYLMNQDWQNVIKFGEGDKEVSKTPYQLCTELIGRMIDMHSEGKAVFVPLDRIGKAESDEDVVVPVGVDADMQRLDSQIQAFSEKYEVSYPDAFRVFEEAQTKGRKPEDVAGELIPNFKLKA